jgi:hypothetical protein
MVVQLSVTQASTRALGDYSRSCGNFFGVAAAAIPKNELGIPTKQPIPIFLFLGV